MTSGSLTLTQAAKANGLADLAQSVTSSGGFNGGSLSNLLTGGNGGSDVGSTIGSVSQLLNAAQGGSGLSGALGGILGEGGLGQITEGLGGLEDAFGGGSGGVGNVISGIGGLFGGGSSSQGSGVSNQVQQIIQGISQVSQAVGKGNQAISQIISPIMQFADQIKQLGEGGFGKLLESMGGGKSGQGAKPELEGLLKQAMGALNLPDPTVIAQGISQVTDSDSTKPVLSGVNAVTRDEIAKAMLNAQSARLIAGGVLSKEAQEATAEQLKGIMEMSAQGKNLATANAQLSGQAQQAGALSAASGAQSAQYSSAVGEAAKGAQSAVSTQDVLKAQANITAMQSSQLSILSDQAGAQSAQLSAQSGQLGNISSQLASDTEIQVFQTTQFQQIAQNMAAVNQSLADMSELEQGVRQKQQIDESSQMRHNNGSWSKVGLR